jgi:hypothetical protein
MRLKCLALLGFSFFVMQNASGQQILTIRGVVSKKLSAERVSQVIIHDLKSNEIMMSDELGGFTVKAAIGDTLLFTKRDYTDQKIVVVNGSDMAVYMQPVIVLSTVTVQGQSTKQELNDVMAGYKQDGVFNNGKSLPALAFLTSPITGLYNLFGSEPARARHFAAYSSAELEAAAVDRRYNLALVKRVTNAPDSIAKEFMLYYTPSYEDLKGWNDYDLMKQVKRRFDYYDKNKQRINSNDLMFPALRETDGKREPKN